MGFGKGGKRTAACVADDMGIAESDAEGRGRVNSSVHTSYCVCQMEFVVYSRNKKKCTYGRHTSWRVGGRESLG